jgi:membrane protein involved in D-alanine export
VRPPENFNKPFLSRNISDFWLRQHRTLTLWLTDYVFSPSLKWNLRLKVFRGRSSWAVAASLMGTMLVSGLWHGTTVGFLLFGIAHGLLLVVYHLWDSWLIRRWGRPRLAQWRKRPLVIAGGIFLTFNATAFAFVFFQLGAREGVQLFMRLLPV